MAGSLAMAEQSAYHRFAARQVAKANLEWDELSGSTQPLGLTRAQFHDKLDEHIDWAPKEAGGRILLRGDERNAVAFMLNPQLVWLAALYVRLEVVADRIKQTAEGTNGRRPGNQDPGRLGYHHH